MKKSTLNNQKHETNISTSNKKKTNSFIKAGIGIGVLAGTFTGVHFMKNKVMLQKKKDEFSTDNVRKKIHDNFKETTEHLIIYAPASGFSDAIRRDMMTAENAVTEAFCKKISTAESLCNFDIIEAELSNLVMDLDNLIGDVQVHSVISYEMTMDKSDDEVDYIRATNIYTRISLFVLEHLPEACATATTCMSAWLDTLYEKCKATSSTPASVDEGMLSTENTDGVVVDDATSISSVETPIGGADRVEDVKDDSSSESSSEVPSAEFLSEGAQEATLRLRLSFEKLKRTIKSCESYDICHKFVTVAANDIEKIESDVISDLVERINGSGSFTEYSAIMSERKKISADVNELIVNIDDAIVALPPEASNEYTVASIIFANVRNFANSFAKGYGTPCMDEWWCSDAFSHIKIGPNTEVDTESSEEVQSSEASVTEEAPMTDELVMLATNAESLPEDTVATDSDPDVENIAEESLSSESEKGDDAGSSVPNAENVCDANTDTPESASDDVLNKEQERHLMILSVKEAILENGQSADETINLWLYDVIGRHIASYNKLTMPANIGKSLFRFLHKVGGDYLVDVTKAFGLRNQVIAMIAGWKKASTFVTTDNVIEMVTFIKNTVTSNPEKGATIKYLDNPVETLCIEDAALIVFDTEMFDKFMVARDADMEKDGRYIITSSRLTSASSIDGYLDSIKSMSELINEYYDKYDSYLEDMIKNQVKKDLATMEQHEQDPPMKEKLDRDHMELRRRRRLM